MSALCIDMIVFGVNFLFLVKWIFRRVLVKNYGTMFNLNLLKLCRETADLFSGHGV